MEKDRLSGVIDMHIHSAPDVRQRKLDDLQLMELAVQHKARAIVIKSHHVPTVDRATLVNKVKEIKYGETSSFEMFGGIALNRFIGGINPWAVDTALKLGGKVVWLPTNTAENHCHKEHGTHPVVCVKNGQVVPELQTVFSLIKDHQAVLATGHISVEECFIVTEAARAAGVEKIVITHPEFHIVGMSLEDQIRIVKDYNVYLERVYAQPIGGGKYKNNIPDNVTAIKEIGAKSIIVATDSGQTQNPYWNDSLSEYISTLASSGISENEIRTMTHDNPAYLLGI
jgi:ribosomal protein L19